MGFHNVIGYFCTYFSVTVLMYSLFPSHFLHFLFTASCKLTQCVYLLGLPNYCDRYGETIVRVSETYGPTPTWKADDPVTLNLEL